MRLLFYPPGQGWRTAGATTGPLVASANAPFAYNTNLSLKAKLLLKFSAAIAALKALGAWGVFIIAVIDASVLGVPVDPLVAGYVYSDPHRTWLYCLAATAGSVLGSILWFYAGRAGGELFLRKRIDEARLNRLRDRFARQEFLAIMIPAMLPPPTPFKLLVISAGVFRMKLSQFLLAIAGGRLLRFGILSVLTLVFGPQIVALIKAFVTRHPWIAVLVGLIIVAVIYVSFRWSGKKEQPQAENESSPAAQ